MEGKTITHQQPWGNELYEFENVPALVCRQCGEVWLEAEVGQLIDRIIKEHPQPIRYPFSPWLNSVCRAMGDQANKADHAGAKQGKGRLLRCDAERNRGSSQSAAAVWSALRARGAKRV